MSYHIERQVVITNSSDETEAEGERLGRTLSPGDVVLLFGELGAGKTTFAKGVCRALGVKWARSPSFVIVNVYCGDVPVYHIDLYRTKELDQVTAAEIAEHIWDSDAVKIVEWAERLPEEIVPQSFVAVRFERVGEQVRRITIERAK